MAALKFSFHATLRSRVVLLSRRLPSSQKSLSNLASRNGVPIGPCHSLPKSRTVDINILARGSLQRTCRISLVEKWPPRAVCWCQQRSVSTKPGSHSEDVSSNRSPTPPSSASVDPTSLPPPLHTRPHEYIWTIPNILTFSRLASAPLIGYFILTTQPVYALSLFAYAAVTDGLDGYIARRFRQQTVVGTVIDPMADKALMTISVVALAVQHTIPPWLAVVILGRDVALSFTAFYYRYISLPPPKTMARYWDFSLPSAEVRPTEISKWNTFLQLLLVGVAMTMPVLPEALVAAWHLNQGFGAFQYLVAGTTVWSGASYLYSKDAVKILTQDEIDLRMKEKEGKEREKSDSPKQNL